jgi:predicted  nucleic acid-binding Zn-ribbon protein
MFLYFTLRQHVSEDYTSIIRSYNNALVRIRDCNACPYIIKNVKIQKLIKRIKTITD